MAAHNIDQASDVHKRKRDTADVGSRVSDHSDRIPQPPPPQSGSGAFINYLSKPNPSKLRLIQSDIDAFSDIRSLIGDYEAVLSRRESLAGNLGARLTAPRLLRAMEGLFEGTIAISPHSPDPDIQTPTTPWDTPPKWPPSWLDIISFAKANPQDFKLKTAFDGRRVCQFAYLPGTQVEISEDDWRLIMSGTLDRFRLDSSQPLDEDENAELATIDILEQRLQTLITRADEIARKARQLNYHLRGRKAGINTRRTSSVRESPQTTDQQRRGGNSSGSNLGYDIHADLLSQFSASCSQASPASRGSSFPASKQPPTPSDLTRFLANAGSVPQLQQQQNNLISPTHSTDSTSQRDQPILQGASSAQRTLIQAKIDRLSPGEPIFPPCDRCRRLKMHCMKHRTACAGCTKKKSKCSWNAVTDMEMSRLTGEAVEGALSSVPPPAMADGDEDTVSNPPGASAAGSDSNEHAAMRGCVADSNAGTPTHPSGLASAQDGPFSQLLRPELPDLQSRRPFPTEAVGRRREEDLDDDMRRHTRVIHERILAEQQMKALMLARAAKLATTEESSAGSN